VAHTSPLFAVRVWLLSAAAIGLAFYEGGLRRAIAVLFASMALIGDRVTASMVESSSLAPGVESTIADGWGALIVAMLGGMFITAERGRRRDNDRTAALGRFLAAVGTGCDSRDVFRAALGELSRLSGAEEVVVVLEDQTFGLVLIVFGRADENGMTIRLRALREPASSKYVRNGSTLPRALARIQARRRVRSLEFRPGHGWRGCLYVINPSWTHDRAAFREGFDALLEQCCGALLATRDVRRIRHEAATRERARLGRELHDGVVQGLASLDLELEAMRHAMAEPPNPALDGALAQIQHRLRQELSAVRDLQRRARGVDIDGPRLVAALHDLTRRFEAETGIETSLVAPAAADDLPAAVCAELLRIVQEALVNVRRHSHARHVRVDLTEADGRWLLTVEDNGSGVATGSDTPLRRPAVIEERARAIGASLSVTTPVAGGTRLQIAMTRREQWTNHAKCVS
jgi:signal transduction histidine kinase